MRSKKGQVMGGLENAPSIIMIVGLVFLTMATMALIGQKYGNSLLNDYSGTVTNESGGFMNGTGYTLAKAGELGFINPVITEVVNNTEGAVIPAGNYTVSTAGIFINTTSDFSGDVNVSYTYTYSYATVAYNTTSDLQTELANNTSIAGIVLTISLVGIVLTILMGVFLGFSRRANRV